MINLGDRGIRPMCNITLFIGHLYEKQLENRENGGKGVKQKCENGVRWWGGY